jgi:hypothetical protein
LTRRERQYGEAVASLHFTARGEDSRRAAAGNLIRAREAPNRVSQLALARRVFDAKKHHYGVGLRGAELSQCLMNGFLGRGLSCGITRLTDAGADHDDLI